MRETVSIKTFVLTAILLVSTTAVISLSLPQFIWRDNPQFGIVDVMIQPREIDVLFGDTELFEATVYNGTAPYIFWWSYNGTRLASEQSIVKFGFTEDFGFTEPISHVILSVMVFDALGNVGFDNTVVYDPSVPSSGPYYLDIPFSTFSYNIGKFSNGTFWAVNGSTWHVDYTGSDATTVMQNAHDQMTNGTISLREGIYTFSTNYFNMTKSNVTLRGVGIDATIIDNTQADEYAIQIQGSPYPSRYRNIKLEDLTILSTGRVGYGVRAYNIHNFQMEDVRLRSLKDYALNLGSSETYSSIDIGTLDNVEVMGLGSSTHNATACAKFTQVDLMHMYAVTLFGSTSYNVTYGLWMNNSKQTKWFGGYTGRVDTGILINQTGFSGDVGSTFDEVSFEDIGKDSFVVNASGMSVTNLRMVGGHFVNSPNSGYQHIRLLGSSSVMNTEIRTNRFTGTDMQLIEISSACSFTEIENNWFQSGATIDNSGTKTTIRGNREIPDTFSEASYTIFVDGSNYCMQDGDTGTVEAYGTNPTEISNWALSNLTNGGKIVYSWEGTVDFPDACVIPYDNIEICGLGLATVLNKTSNGNLFETSGARRYGISSHDMTLTGSSISSGNGIYGSFRNSHFYNLRINQFPDSGIFINGTDNSFDTGKAYENKIYNNHITGKSAFGTSCVRIGNTATNPYASDCEIYDNILYHGRHSIDLYAANIVLQRNHIVQSAETWRCLYIRNSPVKAYDNYFDRSARQSVVIDSTDIQLGRLIELSRNQYWNPCQSANNTYSIITISGSNDIAHVKIDDEWFYRGTGNQPKYILETDGTGTIGNLTFTNNYIEPDAYATAIFDFQNNPTQLIIRANNGYPNSYSSATYEIFKDPDDTSYTCMQKWDTGTVTARSTNASRVFNWAIGNLTSGGEIFIKAGTYTLTASIVDAGVNDIYIKMEKGAKLDLTADISFVFHLTSVSGWVIDGGEIDGNKDVRTTGTGVYLSNAPNSEIKNVYIHDTNERGIVVGSESHYVSVYHNNLTDIGDDTGDTGINIDSSNYPEVTHNILKTIAGIGIVPEYAIGGKINHNTLLLVGTAGENHGIWANKFNQSQINNNFVSNGTDHLISLYHCEETEANDNIVMYGDLGGLQMEDCKNSEFSNNIVYANGQDTTSGGCYGIYLWKNNYDILVTENIISNQPNGSAISMSNTGNGRINIIGNIIRDMVYSGDYYSVIEVYGSGGYFFVANNELYNNQRSGIIVGSSAHNSTVINNQIYDQAYRGIWVYSDNSTVRGNVLRGCGNAALELESSAEYTWVMGNDLRFNTDDVGNQGTNTIWTDNLDRNGGFHEADAPDV